jgi:hypothetical protein
MHHTAVFAKCSLPGADLAPPEIGAQLKEAAAKEHV